MNTPVSSINRYDIAQMNNDAGQKAMTNDFFVFEDKELPVYDEIFRPSRSTHFMIYLLRKGSMEVKVNLIDYTIAKNSVIIIRPETLHQKVRQSDDGEGIQMGFTDDFFGKSMVYKKHADRFDFFSLQAVPLFLLTDEEANLLNTLMLSLKKLFSNEEHPFKEEVMHHGFNLFMFELAAISKKYRGNVEVKHTRKEDILLGFLKLLSQQFNAERSVRYYANSLYITPKHLTKTVKELTTKTCSEFIDEMVIAEAKILLSDHALSVAQVADELHFSDQFFFSKYFKNHTHLNPTEYKNLV